jgi:hypothetical protein
MSPTLVLAAILCLLAGSAVVMLVLALMRGRPLIATPDHLVPWILSLIALGAPASFFLVGAIASSIAEGPNWMIIGAVGLTALLLVALFRPLWAAWVSIGTALALPLLILIGDALASGPLDIDVARAIGFYTVRSLIIGGLLLWSVHPRKADKPAAPSATPAARTELRQA